MLALDDLEPPTLVRGPSRTQRVATAYRVRRYLTRKRFLLDPEQVVNCYDYLDQLESENPDGHSN